MNVKKNTDKIEEDDCEKNSISVYPDIEMMKIRKNTFENILKNIKLTQTENTIKKNVEIDVLESESRKTIENTTIKQKSTKNLKILVCSNNKYLIELLDLITNINTFIIVALSIACFVFAIWLLIWIESAKQNAHNSITEIDITLNNGIDAINYLTGEIPDFIDNFLNNQTNEAQESISEICYSLINEVENSGNKLIQFTENSVNSFIEGIEGYQNGLFNSIQIIRNYDDTVNDICENLPENPCPPVPNIPVIIPGRITRLNLPDININITIPNINIPIPQLNLSDLVIQFSFNLANESEPVVNDIFNPFQMVAIFIFSISLFLFLFSLLGIIFILIGKNYIKRFQKYVDIIEKICHPSYIYLLVFGVIIFTFALYIDININKSNDKIKINVEKLDLQTMNIISDYNEFCNDTINSINSDISIFSANVDKEVSNEFETVKNGISAQLNVISSQYNNLINNIMNEMREHGYNCPYISSINFELPNITIKLPHINNFIPSNIINIPSDVLSIEKHLLPVLNKITGSALSIVSTFETIGICLFLFPILHIILKITLICLK